MLEPQLLQQKIDTNDEAAEKADLKTKPARPPGRAASREEALNAVKQAVTEARTAYLAALAPLAPAERSKLQRELYPDYSLGGLYPSSFKPETPGYEGWGQGVGAGLREVANGGIGVLLEGGGDDLYEYDSMARRARRFTGMRGLSPRKTP